MNKCILFDWGDTLMREFPGYDGKMVDWPYVEAMPGAAEALAALQPAYRLAVATNAQSSDEADVHAALRRVDLDQYFEAVYCFRQIGQRKPAPEFYAYILKDLGLPPEQALMVGDDFQADVLGANRSGLRAVWLNLKSTSRPSGELYLTIHSLTELPEAVRQQAGWTFLQ